MKNVYTSLAAAMLVLWYSLSVIGFDVHTCSRSGNSYIATVISGTDCEDIHPEHQPKTCSCCHHDHTAKDDNKTQSEEPCCTDEWHLIELTGVKTSDEKGGLCGSIYYFKTIISQVETADSDFNLRLLAHGRAFFKPDSGQNKTCDFQQLYNIWRI